MTSSLIDQLDSGNPAVRLAAIELLIGSSPPAEATISIVQSVADTEESVREAANAVLEEMDAPAAETLAALINLLNSASSDVVYWAATLIGRLGGEAAIASKPLGQLLADSHSESARERAAWALQRLGPVATDALPELELAAERGSARLQRLARGAIDAIGSP